MGRGVPLPRIGGAGGVTEDRGAPGRGAGRRTAGSAGGRGSCPAAGTARAAPISRAPGRATSGCPRRPRTGRRRRRSHPDRPARTASTRHHLTGGDQLDRRPTGTAVPRCHQGAVSRQESSSSPTTYRDCPRQNCAGPSGPRSTCTSSPTSSAASPSTRLMTDSPPRALTSPAPLRPTTPGGEGPGAVEDRQGSNVCSNTSSRPDSRVAVKTGHACRPDPASGRRGTPGPVAGSPA